MINTISFTLCIILYVSVHWWLPHGTLDIFVVSMSGHADMKSSHETLPVLSTFVSKEKHKNSLPEFASYIIKECYVKMED
jgi:hypothetical protein